ncbi:hypothetical protein D3C78_1675670 [compost metagenome]
MAEPLPGLLQLLAATTGEVGQQRRHAGQPGLEAEGGEDLGAAIGARGDVVDQPEDIPVVLVDLRVVTFQQVPVEGLHQAAQRQVVDAILLDLALHQVQQLVATGHVSLPVW